MIYFDEQISSHRKILRAGKLLGDDAGGPMAALGCTSRPSGTRGRI